jgi:ABC-type transport system substrate-binding protein
MGLWKWVARGAVALGLATAAGAMAGPATAQTLRMVSHADIKILDPIWTTALITRNHGYMVYDVLFAKDADLKIQPQMRRNTPSPTTSSPGPSPCARAWNGATARR